LTACNAEEGNNKTANIKYNCAKLQFIRMYNTEDYTRVNGNVQ